MAISSNISAKVDSLHECNQTLRDVLGQLHTIDRSSLSAELLVSFEKRAKDAVDTYRAKVKAEVKVDQARSDAMYIDRGMHSSTIAINAHRAIEREALERVAAVEREFTHVVEQIDLTRVRLDPARA